MDKQRIGFVGLGVMGLGMASRLIECGYQVAVYNRTRSKSEELGLLGAAVAASPAEAASSADVVLLSLADQDVASSMLFGEQGVFGSLQPGGYICDTGTVAPAFARALAEKASQAGYHALDACVHGNPQHAREGQLRVMVGGDEADFRAIESLLRILGKEVTYLGGNGMGATMKLVLNMIMGVQMQALAEAVVFADRAGLPRDRVLQLISNSGYSSPAMSFRCGVMGRRSFHQATSRLGLMRRHMMLALTECRDFAVPAPAAESAYTMLTAAQQQGLGDLDAAAILAFQERISGLDRYPWPLQDDSCSASPEPTTGPSASAPGGAMNR